VGEALFGTKDEASTRRNANRALQRRQERDQAGDFDAQIAFLDEAQKEEQSHGYLRSKAFQVEEDATPATSNTTVVLERAMANLEPLIFTEILANPSGSAAYQYTELYNPNSFAINFNQQGVRYKFCAYGRTKVGCKRLRGTVAANSYFVYCRNHNRYSKCAGNNKSRKLNTRGQRLTITLNNVIIADVTYPDSRSNRGQSYARAASNSATWSFQSPSVGQDASGGGITSTTTTVPPTTTTTTATAASTTSTTTTTATTTIPKGSYGPLCPPPQNLEWELQVLDFTNQYRASGARCGGTWHPPAPPLRLNPQLECAARFHTKWMFDNQVMSHNSPDGALGNKAPIRIENSGYDWNGYGENVAFGYWSPQSVVDDWMTSVGHCENIMWADVDEIGIGFWDGNKSKRMFWTQVFGYIL